MGPPSVAAVAFQFQPNSFSSAIAEPRGSTFLGDVSFASLGINSPLIKAEMFPSPRVVGPTATAVARQQTHVHRDGDATPENPAGVATTTTNNTPGADQPRITSSPQPAVSHLAATKKCKTVRFSAAKEIFDGHCVTPPASEDGDAADGDIVSPPSHTSNCTGAGVELQSALLERLSIADGPVPDTIHRHRVPTFSAKLGVPGASDGTIYQRRASAGFGSFAPTVRPDCAEHSQLSAFFTYGDEKEKSAVATEADRYLPPTNANVLFTHVLHGDGFPMLLSSVTPSPTIQTPSSTSSQQYRPSITPESLAVYRASTGGAQYGNADCNNVDAENFVLNRTRVPILSPRSAQQAGHGFYGSQSLPTSPNTIGDAGYFQIRRPQHPLLSPVDSEYYHAPVDVGVHDQVQSAAAYAAMYSYHRHQSAAASMSAGHTATPLGSHLAVHPMPSAVNAITPTGPYGAAVPPRANCLLAYHNLQQPSPPAMPNSLRLADRLGCNHKGYQKRFAAEEKANRYAGVALEDVVGEIYSLCKDQHGCRFLQKKVEERNEKYIEMIYKEVFGRFAELMTDPFGNYLCQKLLEHCSDRQRTAIVEFVASDLVHIAFNMHGTRAVQKMIEFASNPQQTMAIVTALGPHVVVLIKDLNGNHVIQKCLSKLRSEDNQFIYNAVCQSCVEVATHRHGCCVLQRCIDYASDMQKVQLVIEITYHALTLVQDPFGNYVVQYVLDLGDSRFSDAVTRKFVGNVCLLSVQKFSSNVMEKCIRVAETDTRRALISEMLNLDRLDKLLRDAYANYVVQTALDYADPDQKLHLVECMRPLLPAIRHTPYGKRILSKLQRDLIPPVIGQTGKSGMNGQAVHDGFLIPQYLGNGNGQLMPVTVDYKGCFLPYM